MSVDKRRLTAASRLMDGLPLQFVPNRGQFPSNVQFVSSGGLGVYCLTGAEALLEFPVGRQAAAAHRDTSIKPPPSLAERESREALPNQHVATEVAMRLVGATRTAAPLALEALPGKANYFIGNDPRKWRRGIPTYRRISYRNVYPGIDISYYGNQRKLEYDFIIHPRQSPDLIKIDYSGIKAVKIDAGGGAVLSTAAGELRQARPHAYQMIAGKRVTVSSFYFLQQGLLGFKLGKYDQSRDVVIDPEIVYSTLLGGSGVEQAAGMAVDASGNVYITGATSSRDFPLVNSPSGEPASSATFVSKLNPTGTALEYSTFISSDDSDGVATAIAVDQAGSAYITGYTFSQQFPLKNPIQDHNAGGADCFVTKLSPDGGSLVYSTYLGGLIEDYAYGIAVDSSSSACITGITASTNFPTVNPVQGAKAKGGFGAFVSKLDPSGSRLVFSTYLGGSGFNSAYGVAMDAAGNVYVTGATESMDFPLHNPFQSGFQAVTVAKASLPAGTWSPANSGLPVNAFVTSVATDPSDSSTVYVGTEGNGLYRSSDGGATWSAVAGELNVLLVEGIAIDPVTPSTIYVAGPAQIGGSVFAQLAKSTDSGNSWHASDVGIGRNIARIIIDPLNPSQLYALTQGYLYRSTNGGASWSFNQALAAAGYGVSCVAPDPSSGSAAYAGTGEGGIIRTVDGGANWSIVLPQFARFSSTVTNLAVDPDQHSPLYAAIGSAGLFVSNDGGLTWKASLSTPEGPQVTSIVPIGGASPVVYASTTSDGVYFSTNHGKTWNRYINGLQALEVQSLSVAKGPMPVIYAGSAPEAHCFVTKLTADGSSIIYSTFLGGEASDAARGIAVDSEGAAYVTGGTFSRTFPISNATQSSNGGASDAFIAKLDPSGSNLIYSTYFGGSDDEVGTYISLGAAGNVYVAGITDSVDTPAPGGFQTTSAGDLDAFASRFSPDGRLTFASYIGGESFDAPVGIGADGSGSIYVAGTTASQHFPTTPGALKTSLAQFDQDAFIVKINPPDPPVITSARISGKSLLVSGENFDSGALVFINGQQQKTRTDPSAPDTSLIAKKGAKHLPVGQPVTLEVRNGNGLVSPAFTFTREQ